MALLIVLILIAAIAIWLGVRRAATAKTAAVDEDGQPGPVYRLYSRWHVELATFLGSPIAGALLIRANFRRLGNPRAGRHVVLLAAAGSAAVIAGAVFLVSSGMPRPALPLFFELSFLSGVYILFERSMQSLLKAHVSAGGRTGPWWRALGAAAAGFPAFLVVYAAILMMVRLGPTWILDRWTDCVTATRSISLGVRPDLRESVCFTNGATENDARELGEELRKRNVFRGGPPGRCVDRAVFRDTRHLVPIHGSP
jgi:hypothetical protein